MEAPVSGVRRGKRNGGVPRGDGGHQACHGHRRAARRRNGGDGSRHDALPARDAAAQGGLPSVRGETLTGTPALLPAHMRIAFLFMTLLAVSGVASGMDDYKPGPLSLEKTG